MTTRFDRATNSDNWTPATNGNNEWIVLYFATVTVADGIVIKEAAGTAGNGFITRIDLIESGGTAHTVFSGTDPVKLDGYLRITFPLTSYNVAKVKIFVNGQIHSTVLPAIDSVELRRHSVSTTVNGSAVETKFTLDGWNPAKGYAIGLENVDVWTENIVGTSTKTHYTRGDRVDQLLGRVDANGTFWILTDKLGSVRGVVDNGGILAAQTDYDAFGNVIGSFQNPNITTAGLGRYGWTGREVETELGLQYNRARYYDQAMGRWISKDPMGFAAGDSNLYRYVKNGPTNAIDPSGFQEALCVNGTGAKLGFWQQYSKDIFNIEPYKSKLLKAIEKSVERLDKAIKIMDSPEAWKRLQEISTKGGFEYGNVGENSIGGLVTGPTAGLSDAIGSLTSVIKDSRLQRVIDNSDFTRLNTRDLFYYNKIKELHAILNNPNTRIPFVINRDHGAKPDTNAYIVTPFPQFIYVNRIFFFLELCQDGKGKKQHGKYGNAGGQDAVILHELARFYVGFRGDDNTGKRDDVYTFDDAVSYLVRLYDKGVFDDIFNKKQ